MRVLIVLLMILWSSYSALATDSRIKVVVIDTGLADAYKDKAHLCPGEHKDFTGTGLNDTHGHGTNVVGLIVENAPVSNYCIVIVKAYSGNKEHLTDALEYAIKINADVINLSSGGISSNLKEHIAVAKIIEANIVLIAAAGNNKKDLNKGCTFYPACYDPRITVVGSNASTSNYGFVVDVVIPGDHQTAFGRTMSGSSQSTAIFTGRFLKGVAEKQKAR